MSFTAKDVQSLREKTGVGMMDCKKALTEANGDMDKAVELLREKGLAAAEKKAGRIASEGLIACYYDGKAAAMVEVNSETDFVAKNADFQAFVQSVAETAAKSNPADLAALMNATLAGSSDTVTEALREKILTIGENLSVRRFYRAEGVIATYIHGGGRIGVITEFEADDAVANTEAFAELGKDISMQIAAMNPQYLSRDTVDPAVIESEKSILVAQIKNDEKNKNKPDNIIEKMVIGRMGKFYENNCLLDQAFVKDSSFTVGKYVQEKAKELGGKITVTGFVRFEKGEGLQKREDDFASEVAGMIK